MLELPVSSTHYRLRSAVAVPSVLRSVALLGACALLLSAAAAAGMEKRVIVLLDTSMSMEEKEENKETGAKLDRLELAWADLQRQFETWVKEPEGLRIYFVPFNDKVGDVEVVTGSQVTIKSKFEELKQRFRPGGYTFISGALQKAAALLKDPKFCFVKDEDLEIQVLLYTDGEQTVPLNNEPVVLKGQQVLSSQAVRQQLVDEAVEEFGKAFAGLRRENVRLHGLLELLHWELPSKKAPVDIQKGRADGLDTSVVIVHPELSPAVVNLLRFDNLTTTWTPDDQLRVEGVVRASADNITGAACTVSFDPPWAAALPVSLRKDAQGWSGAVACAIPRSKVKSDSYLTVSARVEPDQVVPEPPKVNVGAAARNKRIGPGVRAGLYVSEQPRLGFRYPSDGLYKESLRELGLDVPERATFGLEWNAKAGEEPLTLSVKEDLNIRLWAAGKELPLTNNQAKLKLKDLFPGTQTAEFAVELTPRVVGEQTVQLAQLKPDAAGATLKPLLLRGNIRVQRAFVRLEALAPGREVPFDGDKLNDLPPLPLAVLAPAPSALKKEVSLKLINNKPDQLKTQLLVDGKWPQGDKLILSSGSHLVQVALRAENEKALTDYREGDLQLQCNTLSPDLEARDGQGFQNGRMPVRVRFMAGCRLSVEPQLPNVTPTGLMKIELGREHPGWLKFTWNSAAVGKEVRHVLSATLPLGTVATFRANPPLPEKWVLDDTCARQVPILIKGDREGKADPFPLEFPLAGGTAAKVLIPPLEVYALAFECEFAKAPQPVVLVPGAEPMVVALLRLQPKPETVGKKVRVELAAPQGSLTRLGTSIVDSAKRDTTGGEPDLLYVLKPEWEKQPGEIEIAFAVTQRYLDMNQPKEGLWPPPTVRLTLADEPKEKGGWGPRGPVLPAIVKPEFKLKLKEATQLTIGPDDPAVPVAFTFSDVSAEPLPRPYWEKGRGSERLKITLKPSDPDVTVLFPNGEASTRLSELKTKPEERDNDLQLKVTCRTKKLLLKSQPKSIACAIELAPAEPGEPPPYAEVGYEGALDIEVPPVITPPVIGLMVLVLLLLALGLGFLWWRKKQEQEFQEFAAATAPTGAGTGASMAGGVESTLVRPDGSAPPSAATGPAGSAPAPTGTSGSLDDTSGETVTGSSQAPEPGQSGDDL